MTDTSGRFVKLNFDLSDLEVKLNRSSLEDRRTPI